MDGTNGQAAKRPILTCFSGGRTSAFLARFVKEYFGRDRRLLFVFANTGRERPETLDFAHRCDRAFGLDLAWLEADISTKKGVGTGYRIVDYKTADRNGGPFERAIKKYGLPSRLYRHCTRELKIVPAHKYARDVLGKEYETAIGIRADERHRAKNAPGYIYPLVDLNVDEAFVRGWWKKQDFDLQLKDYQGNCDLCFLKSRRKKLTLINENPQTADWWSDMERRYGSEFQSRFDHVNNLSVPELVELAKKPFARAVDKEDARENSPRLFDRDMDMEHGCFCGSA